MVEHTRSNRSTTIDGKSITIINGGAYFASVFFYTLIILINYLLLFLTLPLVSGNNLFTLSKLVYYKQ